MPPRASPASPGAVPGPPRRKVLSMKPTLRAQRSRRRQPCPRRLPRLRPVRGPTTSRARTSRRSAPSPSPRRPRASTRPAGVPFGAYARRRIVGALADELRSQDWAPRSARRPPHQGAGGRDGVAHRVPRSRADRRAGRRGDGRRGRGRARGPRRRRPLDRGDGGHHLRPRRARGADPGGAGPVRRGTARGARGGGGASPDQLRHVVEQVYFAGRSVGQLAAELGISHSTVSHARIEAVRLLREGVEADYSGREAKGPAAPLTRPAGGSTSPRWASASRAVPRSAPPGRCPRRR